ncbi:MAG: cytochrome c biogenesis protein CcsA [Gemmatimonadetes bacterium]|nr:cytochrome c biogenesis protein [Gemmatimonadota bacterium]NNM04223.1 cytochrome c biogenesis protein CcsA [Gemmatimonadota bacterium]
METVLQLLNVLLPLGYLLAAVAYLVVFLEAPEWAKTWATRITLAVVGVHFSYLLLVTLTYRHVPMANSWEGFSFIAFAMAAVYLALEWRWKDQATGVFLLVPVLFFQIFSSAFVTHTRDVDEILRSSLFAFHVTTALLGYVALSVAAVYGTMYALLYKELKTPRVGLIFRRLPSLETLTRMTMGAVLFGWVALTLAIVFGSIWAGELASRGWLDGTFLTDPKFFLTLALWALYSFTLGGRYLFRWPNRHVAYLSIIAFILLLGSSLVVNLFLPSFHRFS